MWEKSARDSSIFLPALCGIGWLIDLIMTACGSFTDKAGLPLKL